VSKTSDDRVTTAVLHLGQAATLRRLRGGLLNFFCAAALFGAALPAMAQSAADADVSAAPSGNLSALLEAEAAAAPQAEARPKLSARIQDILSKAVSLLGTPYRWGGTSPDGGFDCSGLVGYVFRTALGIDLPRVSRDQAKTGELISDRAALVAGDLVFFGRRGRVDHVGIYVGEGRFLHAPSTGKDVRVDSMASGYWSGKFMQARRVAM
jgi:cell wall-associated NlpC family hydrolase